MSLPVSVNTPILKGRELEYLTECIETGWISSEGPFIYEFEQKFASFIGRDYGVACSNGSAALDIAIAALEIGQGDEVILPTFTIISPALSVVRSGATPILVDSELDTWNMDVTKIEAKITDKTKAIIVVHIYGLPVDMAPILELCKRYNLHLIEDAAEMHGQEYENIKCGSFGDISTFSFYPNKIITTGEGGMILTNNKELADRCMKLRNLAFEPNERRFVHYELGWNYRMTNLQAALGLAQLQNIESFISIKRDNGNFYHSTLAFLTNHGYLLPVKQTVNSSNIYWVFGLIAPSVIEAECMLAFLKEKNIGTRPFFWCMHEQPVFKKMGLFQNEEYPIAERIARCGFYIPSGLGLTTEDRDRVVNAFHEYYR